MADSPSVRKPIQLHQNSDVIPEVRHFIDKAYEFRLHYQYIESDKCLDTALMLSIKASHAKSLAKVYLNKGIVKKFLNDKVQALDFYIRAMVAYEKLNDQYNLTICYLEMAEFYRKAMQFPDAVEYIVRAKKSYSENNFRDTLLLTKIYNRSAAINNECNPDKNESIKDSRMALKLAMSLEDSSLMAVSYNELGYTYKNLRQFDSAEFYYLEAERLWMGKHKYQEALHAMTNRAQLYLHFERDKDDVISLYKRVIYLADSLNVNYRLMDVTWVLYALHLEKGDTISAFKYFQKFHDESSIVYNTQTTNEYYNINAKFKNEKIQSQFNEVKEKLNESSKVLETQRAEQKYLITFVVILLSSLAVITFLLFRLRNSHKELAKKNYEKDTLIQEIHHRVKNNLQFISSLMNMQMKVTDSVQETKTLNDTSRRISAMALVHEMLYNQSDKSGIAVKMYIQELVESLNDLVNSEEDKIQFELTIADEDFNVADAISLGMISSELISNSMKHAFQQIEQPKVKISLIKAVKNGYIFSYEDNGVGFNNDNMKKQSLGLRLVDIFSRQLKGEYHINGKNGFHYSIQFNLK